jgi:hypothetical protein
MKCPSPRDKNTILSFALKQCFPISLSDLLPMNASKRHHSFALLMMIGFLFYGLQAKSQSSFRCDQNLFELYRGKKQNVDSVFLEKNYIMKLAEIRKIEKRLEELNNELEKMRKDTVVIDDSSKNGSFNKKYNEKLDSIDILKAKIGMGKGNEAILDLLNQKSAVSFLGGAGASEVQATESAIGNLSLGLRFRLTDYKYSKRNPKKIDPLFAYVLFNARSAISADSSQLRKAVLFPAIHRRDFVLGFSLEQIYWDSQWSVNYVGEFSLARHRGDTESINVDTGDTTKVGREFVTQNFLFGVDFQKSFEMNRDAEGSQFFSLSFFPYYQGISIDPKHWEDYGILLNEDQLAPTLHTAGLKTTVLYESARIFADVKYVMNNQNSISPDMKRLVFTIGTQIDFN